LRAIVGQRDFLAYFFARQLAGIAYGIEEVAIGWQVFGLRHNPFDLGLVGLVLFVPFVLLALPAGYVADRFDRKLVCVAGGAGEFAAMLIFVALAQSGSRSLPLYLAATFAIGLAHAMLSPAERSLLVLIVQAHDFVRAQSFTSSFSQLIQIAGPAVGGALLIFGPGAAFGTSAICFAASTASIALLRPRGAAAPEAVRWRDITGGIHYILANKVVLGAISLDLFAVLFGGATALLPVYADTILKTGPAGLGLLRSAPAIGGTIVAAAAARRPIQRNVGPLLFLNVAGFGIATIVFGLSSSLPLALAALCLTGGFDMISMLIRNLLVQLSTPNEMRGRVSAVENVFIATSNELVAFESGTLASFVGTPGSVTLGGLGTLIVIALWAVLFPQLRTFDRIQKGPDSTVDKETTG
jgi:MFS family permease